jgi:hypothetical protein
MGRVGAAVIVIDDAVYAVGGENAEGPLRSTERWKPDDARWMAVGAMTVPRARHTATALDDNWFLVAGGGGDHPNSRLAELWDGERFVPAGRMSSVRSRHAATRLQDGRVLVTGGRDARGIPLADAELWDPRSHRWSRAGSLLQARCCHTATLLRDGRVLVVGGLVKRACIGDKPPCYGSIDGVEIWDPKTSRFSAAAPLGDDNDRAAHTATLLNDGRVLVAGGAPENTGEYYTQHDLVWDPMTGTWRIIEAGTRRAHHTATLLPDGTVLAIGGEHDLCGCCARPPGTRGEFVSDIELFDPAKNQWRVVGESLMPRDRHGAAALSDGSVLIVGGESQVWGPDIDTPLATTERWMPAD